MKYGGSSQGFIFEIAEARLRQNTCSVTTLCTVTPLRHSLSAVACAPNCVFHCASDCGTVRSLLALSIYLNFEILSIIFLDEESVYVDLLANRYKPTEIFETLF